jgi:decaprenylphospho-beta-D-erythro-pentofuranosid-2-ulose 2-reductase
VRTVAFDAVQVSSHQELVAGIFAEGPVDLVISAAGVLTPQPDLERDVRLAAEMIETNFTGQVTTLLAVAGHLRAQHQGTIVVLSSVAAVRPRRANFVYGATKSALDAFARGLADSLHGSGVRVVLVRPGFVIGRMTAGMPQAPLATTPEKVGAATAAALRGRRTARSRRTAAGRRAARSREAVWVPAAMASLAIVFRLIPRPLWRRVSR